MRLSSIAFLGAISLALPVPARGQETLTTPPEAGWIGIRIDVGAPGRLPNIGARFAILVTDVYLGGPADEGGLLPGDRLIAVNGTVLETYDHWRRSLARVTPGESLHLGLVRNGSEQDVTVVAGRRPQSVEPALSVDLFFSTGARLARSIDSLMQAVIEGGWSGLEEAPSISWAQEVLLQSVGGTDSVTWRVTFGDSVAIEWADASKRMLAFERLMRENARRSRQAMEQLRADEEEMRLLEETFVPPAAGGGGPDTTRVDVADASQPQLLLTPYIVGSSVVLGGALVRDLNEELGRGYFGVGAGVLITDIVPGSPAERAGLLPGDVIISVNDTEVATVTQLRVDLADVTMPVELTVVRQRNQVKLSYPGR